MRPSDAPAIEAIFAGAQILNGGSSCAAAYLVAGCRCVARRCASRRCAGAVRRQRHRRIRVHAIDARQDHGRRGALAERRGRARVARPVVHHHRHVHRPEASAVEPLPASHQLVGRQPRPTGRSRGHVLQRRAARAASSSRAARNTGCMAGLPGGLGFEVYPPGQKLTIYLQRVGFRVGHASRGADAGETCRAASRRTTVPDRPSHAQHAHGRGRAPAGSHVQEWLRHVHLRRSRIFTAARCGGPSLRDARACIRTRTACAPRCSNTAASDDQYLLLRVPVADGNEAASLVPYLVLNGRIVPPIDIGACAVNVEKVQRAGARPATWTAATRRARCSRSCASPPSSGQMAPGTSGRIRFPAARLAVERDLHLEAARLALRAAQSSAGLLERDVPAEDVSQRCADPFRARAGIDGR